jgi:hypothetical protein
MSLARRFLPLLLATFLLAGCADSAGPDATGPSLSPGTALEARKGEPNLRLLASFKGPHSREEIIVKQWIGAEGGRLELDGFAIEVPEGAVKKERLFTIRFPAQRQQGKRVVADFGPHGAKFLRPIAIELPYAGTSIEGDPGVPTIVWWDADSKAWVDMGGSVTADGQRVRTETTHFSLFGLTLRRSGGVTVSGG